MIRLEGSRILDDAGRSLLVRGVSLGGSSKVPVRSSGETFVSQQSLAHRDVSFVGRPFPVEEADAHFARLRSWGYSFVRLLITWEAIEHAGPDVYDVAYLDSIAALAHKATEYDLCIIIDPHQDVWSRFTGGDGAPGWTLEAVGVELASLQETGAAVLSHVHSGPQPPMIWPTNASKLASATMFTLFFAGNDFAPQTRIRGEPVQEFLQRHYCAAFAQLAARLCKCPNVVGYEVMNEPSHGYIAVTDLRRYDGVLRLGASPTPYEGMLLGAGYALPVERWKMTLVGPQRAGTSLVNANRASAWRKDMRDIWRQHGVWEVGGDGQPRLLRSNYFAQIASRRVDFAQDYYRPFVNRFAHAIRAVHPSTILFVEPEVGHAPPCWGSDDASNIVYAPHWYDGLTLMLKRYVPWLVADMSKNRAVLGPRAARRSIASQLRALKHQGSELLQNAPTIIGETGIPFDLYGGKAFRTGDFNAQIAAVNRVMRGIEESLSHCLWWNYTPDNDYAHGDHWNEEDLSIFSLDQRSDPHDFNSGGRALLALTRPYPRAVAGTLLTIRFEPRHGLFRFTFRHDPTVTTPTEIFVPALQYPHGYEIAVSDGICERQPESQLLLYRHTHTREAHTLQLRRVP
jgi:hypothetical protein